MTRRVLGALLGLTVLLLAGVVVPLGVITARHYRQVFAERTMATATALAAKAEEQLADPRDRALLHGPLERSTDEFAGYDDYAVYDEHRRLVEGEDELATGAMLGRALAGHQTRSWSAEEDGPLTIVLPIDSERGIVGALALRRSSEPVRHQIARLWLGLGAAGALALLLAMALTVLLARWAGRPLSRLESAAARLGGGDLTARVRLTNGPAEVRQLARTFDEMAGRLETLVHGHRSLVADVSHQLRTPLAAMRLRLELLLADLDGPPAQELAAALAEAARLSRLVDGLLAIARAEHAAPEPQAMPAAQVLNERVAAWRPVAEEKDVRLVVEVTGYPVVSVTPGHLEQVLDNLLANALEATPSGGEVRVSAAPHDGRVRLVVADSGPGMSAAQRGQAFHRFWRGGDDPAHAGGAGLAADGGAGLAANGGSGLGLAIVERLVTVNGGTVTLAGGTTGGLRVSVELPPAR